jgi:hypothetical protein
MSSGRDMIAVVGFDSLYNRTQCLVYRAAMSSLSAREQGKASVVCQLLDSRPAKSSHDFLELHPTLCRGSTGFSASLDATFGLTSSCARQTSRLHPSSHPPEVSQVNMWILPLLGYVGVILGFAFLTLAIGTLQPCT